MKKSKIDLEEVQKARAATKVASSGVEGLGGVASGLGAIAGGVGLYNTLSNLDQMQEDKAALSAGLSGGSLGGSLFGVPGFLVGGGAGALVGKFGNKVWGSSKGRLQRKNDAFREVLEGADFLDSKGRYTLSDGSIFEMGKDGGFRYSDGLAAYEVDHENPLHSVVFGHVLPVADVITGGDEELKAAFAGYFTRAAISNSDGDLSKSLSNVRDLTERLGFNQQKIEESLKIQAEGVGVDSTNLAAYEESVRNIFREDSDRVLNFEGMSESSIEDGLSGSAPKLPDMQKRDQSHVEAKRKAVSKLPNIFNSGRNQDKVRQVALSLLTSKPDSFGVSS